MPEVNLSPRERRLANFSRVFAVLYATAAALFAIAPGPLFRVAGETRSFLGSAFASALCAALAAACAVASARPRERRHALLAMVIGTLVTSALAAVELLRASGAGRRPALALLATDLPLFLAALLVYRGAAPGVHSAPAREGPPEQQPEPRPVRIGVSKSS